MPLILLPEVWSLLDTPPVKTKLTAKRTINIPYNFGQILSRYFKIINYKENKL